MNIQNEITEICLPNFNVNKERKELKIHSETITNQNKYQNNK